MFFSFLMVHPLYRWDLEYAGYIPRKMDKTPLYKKRRPGYDTKLHRMFAPQISSFRDLWSKAAFSELD